MKAGGLTLRQFEAELKKKLADGYFKNPQVSVAVETYRSQRIFIVGEVRSPGTYPLTGDMTLIEAIARAGSTTPERQPRGHRRPRAGRERRPTGPMLPGQKAEARRRAAREPARPSERGARAEHRAAGRRHHLRAARRVHLRLRPGQKPRRLRAAGCPRPRCCRPCALAGGVTDRGATNRIKIVRVVKGEKVELKVKLTDLVLPGDTIIVPEKYF